MNDMYWILFPVVGLIIMVVLPPSPMSALMLGFVLGFWLRDILDRFTSDTIKDAPKSRN